MIGISISLYDRFEELGILTEIIRDNWNDTYHISVCSNHPNAKQKLSEFNIKFDEFTQGEDINYNPSMDGIRGQVNKISRVYDTIRKATKGAAKNKDVTHVFHLHADAWPLSEEHVKTLMDEMDSRDKHVAFKGRGLSDRGTFPLGHIMDQFFMVSTSKIGIGELFKHEPTELLPDRGIHTLMAVLLLGKVGWSNVYYYSDQQEQELWNGEKNTGPRPMMYLPEYEFVHIANEDFIEDTGKKLQAYYLKEQSLTTGKNISEFLDKWGDYDVMSELDNTEDSYNKRLKKIGKQLEDFGYNHSSIEGFLSGLSVTDKVLVFGKTTF